MNVADIIIVIALVLGAIGGFKAGVIKKTADFVCRPGLSEIPE